jgi:hypothetical protein
MLANVGVLYLLMEFLDFLNIYTRAEYGRYAIVPLLLVSLLHVISTRRPITKFSHRFKSKDYVIDVRIGDVFDGDSDVIVSTNSTFDTSMSDGLIDTDSLQGQVATRFFNANTAEIDRQIQQELANAPSTQRPEAPGKKLEYPIGTVARVKSHGRTFYFLAMARLNSSGTAGSNIRHVEDSLVELWSYILSKGELRPLSIPLIGTGRGRTGVPRKKMVERIAQSFADGSRSRIFSDRLSIVVRPEDAANFEVNLYEIRDYLVQSLHT